VNDDKNPYWHGGKHPRSRKLAWTMLCALMPLPFTGHAQEGASPDQRIGVLLAAGDIAGCFQAGSRYKEVAALIGKEVARVGGIPVGVLVLGDLAYANRKAGKIVPPLYAECFQDFVKHWGEPHHDALLPVPGNHDVSDDPSQGGVFRKFFEKRLMALSADPTASFYATRFPDVPDGWLVAGLNYYVGRDRQKVWLKGRLAQSRERCVLVFTHAFLNSSGHHGRTLPNGTNPDMQPFMNIMNDAGATVLVTAHDHHLEQFKRQDRTGKPVSAEAKGVRSFLVGTGGAQLYRVPDQKRHLMSEFFSNKTWGVLKLELYADRYTWSFVDVSGKTIDLPVGAESCNAR
jgi:hypothetical protein